MRPPYAPLTLLIALLAAAPVDAKETIGPKAGKEMTRAIASVNRKLGLESYPSPHCLKWGYGHQITADEVKECVAQALKEDSLPDLGKSYVLAVLMAAVGPQTVIAIALDTPGWAALSCDPGRPCPPRHAGTDKLGKRVVDRTERACKNDSTLWFPEKKGCP